MNGAVTRSLRWRLLCLMVLASALALVAAGLVLSGLFRSHVMQQFEAGLTRQLDQLTARLRFDETGQPQMDTSMLTDPRWSQPYSGLYWQLDAPAPSGGLRRAVLRSRSLWDTELALQADALVPGVVHAHALSGPGGAALRVLERSVLPPQDGAAPWRLVVAAALAEVDEASARFDRVLVLSLLALLGFLALAVWVQIGLGLRPLRHLQQRVMAVREGQAARLQGRFPLEVQPLVDDFNGLLAHSDAVVSRARTQAGNLAHALKTPLTVIDGAVADAPAAVAALVHEQVALARRQVDWHLARARMAATQRLPGSRCEVAPVLAGLVRVMQRVHAARALDIETQGAPARFAGEEQDLQEMLGNLLDNACKWATQVVRVSVSVADGQLCLVVDDDGPGIHPEQARAVRERGARLDERVPGAGLGLAIVDELAHLYGGRLQLEPGTPHGLKALLWLPAA